MAARKKKKTAIKKTVKTVRKKVKKTIRKAMSSEKPNINMSQAREFNRKALWKAYRDLQARAEKAWEKFHDNVQRNASPDVLMQDRNQLLMMLGECNYMARECMRISASQKKARR